MTLGEGVLLRPRTRAERVRARRARERRRRERPAKVGRPRRRRRPRRRYDVALPVTLGAEMQLPALPALRVGPRLLTLALLVLTLWGGWRVLSGPTFWVEAASVEGNELLGASLIRSLARVEDRPAFLVDPAAAEAHLLGQPEIAEAEVTVGWPNRVHIRVVERQPKVAWEDGGRTWWLSSDGVAFLAREDRPGLMRIVSEKPVLAIQEDPLAPAVAPQLLVAASVLQAQLPEATYLVYDPDHGLGIDDPGGWRAYFGVDGDMVTKVRLYRAITRDLAERGVRPAMISVEIQDAPYYREAR